ncbi:MAG: transketolase [Sphingobacteriaceae bacterium]|nr:transketolase [Sphingobacteriaceae bacterium]
MSAPLDQRVIAELKGLVMDATRKANSGHPGGAFSSADFAVILFCDYLRFAPMAPKWHNRDRFVLSAGHESMLLYSLLHFMDLLPIEELENFRQLGSLTPGHPESHLTPGVEATTGPLGQGVSMAVGMAIAALHQQEVLGSDLINNKIYSLVGDGDLQEDVALGAMQIAGHLGLHNLVVYYDKNDIQISGKTERVSSVNFRQLFEAMQWEVLEINGHDHAAIRASLDHAQTERSRPLLIIGETVMAKGAATMEGSHKTHGEPLKPEEIAATKSKLGLNPEAFFQVSEEVKDYFTANLNTYNDEADRWEMAVRNRRKADSSFDTLCGQLLEGEIDLTGMPSFAIGEKLATRVAFGKMLEFMGQNIPGIMGGSADLEPSNNTGAFAAAVGEFSKSNRAGRNLAFGVREFPMAAILNGMALYGGMLPYGATFLTFSDYSRNAIRMSAIQELQVLHVFTHDSIFLGEDGPTHQSIEHVMSLRTIPSLLVFRPADARETVASMVQWLEETHRPSLLALTRQNVPTLDGPVDVARGGYIKYETQPGEAVEIVIFASGSEVWVAIEAAQKLAEGRGNIRVISLPCWELFDEQPADYRRMIYSLEAKYRVSIEAGVTLGWQRFTGIDGLNIGVDTFGLSAPGDALAEHFGLTPKQVAERIAEYMEQA